MGPSEKWIRNIHWEHFSQSQRRWQKISMLSQGGRLQTDSIFAPCGYRQSFSHHWLSPDLQHTEKNLSPNLCLEKYSPFSPPSSGMLGLEGSHPISLSLQIGRKKKSLWKELRHDYLMMQSQFCIQGLFFSFRTFLFLIFPAKLSCLVYSPNLLPWPMAIRHLSSENNCWLSLILQVFSYFHSFITVILVKF